MGNFTLSAVHSVPCCGVGRSVALSLSRMQSPTQSGGADSPTSQGAKLLLFLGQEKTTPFAPVLMEKLARLKTMHGQITKLIAVIRSTAQRNPLFRGDRLVASALNLVSERQQYGMSVKDAAVACFDNVKPLSDYADEMANAMLAIAGYEDIMLRQITIFGVKPLQEFLTVQYPRIMAEVTELEKRRDKYDAARQKKSAIDIVAAHALMMCTLKPLESSLNAINEHQMTMAKCIDVAVRAECQFFKETKAVIEAVRGPEHKKRWATT